MALREIDLILEAPLSLVAVEPVVEEEIDAPTAFMQNISVIKPICDAISAAFVAALSTWFVAGTQLIARPAYSQHRAQ